MFTLIQEMLDSHTVNPAGIDRGLLAACIDACDQVMGKFGYPRGLIRYSTENALAAGWDFRTMVRRVFRTRTLLYGAILLGVTALLAGALALRVPLKVDIVRDRASLAREVEGGRIENVYRIQLMNTQERPHRYRIAASGLPGITVASDAEVEVPAATTRQVPLRIQIDPGATGKAEPSSSDGQQRVAMWQGMKEMIRGRLIIDQGVGVKDEVAFRDHADYPCIRRL